MPDLTTFWTWLEDRPRPAGVPIEWRESLGASLEVVRPLIRATGEVAESYPNRPPCGDMLSIVEHRDGSLVAVCREGRGTRIELTRSDVAVHELDFSKLRKVLAEALGLAISRAPLQSGRRGVLEIGRWEPKPGAAFPVMLVRATSQQQARDTIHPMVATAEKETLVLTPTRDRWTEDLPELCERHKCVLAPLDEIIAIEGESFVATDDWQGYLDALCRHGKLKLASNYQNKNPRKKRASVLALAEKARKALVEHIRASRDGVVANIDAGRGAQLVEVLTKSELGRRAGLKPYEVTRAFQAEPQLDRLFQIANDAEQTLRFGK